MTYSIFSVGGQAMSEGIESETEARRVAQQLADETGQTVYLDTVPSSTDPDDDDDPGEAIAPTADGKDR